MGTKMAEEDKEEEEEEKPKSNPERDELSQYLVRCRLSL